METYHCRFKGAINQKMLKGVKEIPER